MNKESLLRRLNEAGLKSDHLPNTRDTYQRVVGFYLDLVKNGEVVDYQGFLEYLAIKGAPSSVRLALNAGVFFCSEVLGRDRPVFKIPTCRKRTRIPVFMIHAEVLALISKMEPEARLKAALMYGCGLRPSELFALRCKDIDSRAGMLIVRGGKGDKDRSVCLPDVLRDDIRELAESAERDWEKDHKLGIICPVKLPSLRKKLGRRVMGSLPWRWLFPSRVTRGDERWHATTRGFEQAVTDAAAAAGIVKWITPRTFRHSYATNLLRAGVDIRTLQFQLGHSDVKTTEIYTHAAGMRGTMSPMDRFDSHSGDIIPFPRSA